MAAHVGLDNCPTIGEPGCEAFGPAFTDVADLIAIWAKEEPPFDCDVHRYCVWVVSVMRFWHEEDLHSILNKSPYQLRSGGSIRIVEASAFHRELINSSFLV